MRGGSMRSLCFFLCIFCLSRAHSWTFDVRDFGAKGDGITDDTQAFMSAWKRACSADGLVKVWVPKATYLVGPLQFYGPCVKVSTMIFQMEAHLKASNDLNNFVAEAWLDFMGVQNLILDGGGTFDGQGASAWPYNKCANNFSCKLLPVSLKFLGMNNTVVSHINSVDSKLFHMGVVNCINFTADNLRITAPADSPNTDGIHIERSTGVTIASSFIGTGDDCISIGQGNSIITITGVTCGPGHGISVGSLGKYPNEGDVKGLVVMNCTFSGTTNGVRIKTWSDSPGESTAFNMTFTDLVMDNAMNPIIIDQSYCPMYSCSSKVPSRVKLRDISFDNIRGTSATQVAVSLGCSKGEPCQNVNLRDVNLNYTGTAPTTSICHNVQATYSGTQVPPPCQ